MENKRRIHIVAYSDKGNVLAEREYFFNDIKPALDAFYKATEGLAEDEAKTSNGEER